MSAVIAGEAASAYLYVVRTAKWNDSRNISQFGSAPNFQGGRITLCTCKHSMRAGRRVWEWPGTWIAGLTSAANGPQALFYLMRVQCAFESHCELWQHLPTRVCRAKSMALHRHGDLCQPRRDLSVKNSEAHFDPENYESPCDIHSHRNSWKRDLDYRASDRRGRYAPLLLGDPNLSFLWSKPNLCWPRRASKLTRGCKKYGSVVELLNSLERLG